MPPASHRPVVSSEPSVVLPRRSAMRKASEATDIEAATDAGPAAEGARDRRLPLGVIIVLAILAVGTEVLLGWWFLSGF
jgi:hypothetical protein